MNNTHVMVDTANLFEHNVGMKWIIPLLGLLGLIMLLNANATEPDYGMETMRSRYQDAMQALNKGDRLAFWAQVDVLHKYPLYPYLRYADINTRLSTVKSTEIRTFLKAFPDSPLSWRLQNNWLQQLGLDKRWQAFLAEKPLRVNTTLRCYTLHAKHALKRTFSIKQFSKIWLSGRSLPSACDSVIELINKQGKLTSALVWQRIELAMRRGNRRLARYLRHFLDKEEHIWLQEWLDLHRHARLSLKPDAISDSNPYSHAIRLHSLSRLIRTQPDYLKDHWLEVSKLNELSTTELLSLGKKLALALAYRYDPDADDWLERIPANMLDKHVVIWRLRVALHNRDWENVKQLVTLLPKKTQQSSQWQYWLARALANGNHADKAKIIFRKLARQRSYEGFLSAERLQHPYSLQQQALSIDKDILANLLSLPAVARSRELLFQEQMLDARREWHFMTRNMDEIALKHAAYIASNWSWHDRAIYTLAQTQYRNDLEIRFPLPYDKLLKTATSQGKIDTAWAYAVIRQESSFNPDAQSPKNARGLMQLLPGTAKRVARKLDGKTIAVEKLGDAKQNIRLGLAYLNMLLDKTNNPILAMAAYNAGKNAVKRWLPEQSDMDADIWIETIPYRETRNYLKNILAYTLIYENRLNLPYTALDIRMPPVLAIASGSDTSD
ncbi:MAG TPA: hypothetical protein ENI64_13815 [Gammaproteobacteria bacterium]|nr:hypothetical protein [Gammaproteobacteria bacterium]